ncbi:MAG: efflux RND transporter periplasmic adaptor subunit [Thermoguttaceae bacterium]|jgi:RND family efflux transporter MFP subunit
MNRFIFITLLAVDAAVPGFIAGCNSSTSAKQQPAGSAAGATAGRLHVAAGQPQRKTLRLESAQPGWIEAFEQTPLLCKLPAYVEKLHADIGDRVEADQLLVELWIPEMQDELQQKEAAVVQTRAEIEQAAAAVRAAEAALATAQANISLMEAGNVRADADYIRWQSQYERISKLVADGSLDRKLQDETQDSLKAAEAAQAETRAKVASAKATLSETRAKVASAKANEALTRARLGNAQADLSRQKTLLKYTQIRAPYDGVVTERNVVRGDFVQPAGAAMAKPLLTVARTDVVRVFVDVPEMESSLVEPGRPGYISVQAIPDKIVEGKVTRTSWALGANRTLRTELDLPNPDAALRPGMYATAHIILQEHPDVYVLPISAVVREDKRTYCWTVQEGRAVRTPITLGLQVGNDVEVVSGLKPDEIVIQTQVGSLQDGQAVEVAQPDGR